MKKIKESDLEKIANWIIIESNSPSEEIKWLLKVAYTTKKPSLTFQEAWGDILTEKSQ